MFWEMGVEPGGISSISCSRQGCIHGEELSYMFGAPLVGGMMHFPRNYTKSEILLSEATMIYWSNFARTGNPNEPQEAEPVHGIRQERNRFKNIYWQPYEVVHKSYLSLDTKPKIKNHYRAHRLSFWLNLIPDLHRPGGDEVPRSHHQLENEEHSHQFPAVSTTSKKPSDVTTLITSPPNGVLPSPTYDNNSTLGLFMPPVVVVAPSSSDRGPMTEENILNPSLDDGFAAYSTALSVTIAIGCSLLILNVLIFAGVYYQRDKTRHPHHHHRSHEGSAGSVNSNGSSNGTASMSTGTLKKRAENGGPICVTGGATELLQIMETRASTNVQSILKTPTSDASILVLQPPHQGHRTISPEFVGNGGGTLPRPPPPPKTPKPPEMKSCSIPPESQPLLPTHGTIQLINTHPGTGGTLNRKSQGKQMEELRV